MVSLSANCIASPYFRLEIKDFAGIAEGGLASVEPQLDKERMTC